jgi:hypothetical protein
VGFERGDPNCLHAWGPEQNERVLDYLTFWRTCTKCGEKRPTRSLSRGPMIYITDHVHGITYVIGSNQNRAKKEFRYLRCLCGNSVRVDFELEEDFRVIRKAPVTCDWCGERYAPGCGGPDDRPRGGWWEDAPEVD